MKVSLMAGVQPSVKVVNWSWAQFCAGVQEQSIPQKDESDERKKQAVSFSCCEYSPPHRRLDNIVEDSIWAIVLDLDRVISPERCLATLDRWSHIGWTTWSSEPGHEKWRVVIPGRVDRRGLSGAVSAISSKLAGAAQVDPSSKDAAHLWFFPWHRWSRRGDHRIWVNEGESWGGGLVVDFSDTPSTRPEKVGSGGRNTALHRYLGGVEARRCESVEDLVAVAMAWNKRLPEPMGPREVRSVANKKWHWLDRNRMPAAMPDILWTFDEKTAIPKLRPIMGDILFPGLTLLTAKMKEGKTFIAAQLAVSLASGTTFLNGKEFVGFSVPDKQKVVMIVGEDDKQTIEHRIIRNLKVHNLPRFVLGDLAIVFPDGLASVKAANPKVDGTVIFDRMLGGWYESGYRVVMIDPLRAMEAGLGIREYPGTEGLHNVHTRDFLTTVWYNMLAQKYKGLCIVVSLHHGKNKRDHDMGDPGDMIAGTTGLGAGAMTTISLLPMARYPSGREEKLFESEGPKQRELYIHGRLTRQKRLLVEQHDKTGLWSCLGDVIGKELNEARTEYFEALRVAGADKSIVTADEIAGSTGRRKDTVHKVLRRMARSGCMWNGLKVIIQHGRGYRLVSA